MIILDELTELKQRTNELKRNFIKSIETRLIEAAKDIGVQSHNCAINKCIADKFTPELCCRTIAENKFEEILSEVVIILNGEIGVD